MIGGQRFLRPGGRGSFGLNADALELRGGCASTLQRFLRTAKGR
jgi:hypothetical protein